MREGASERGSRRREGEDSEKFDDRTCPEVLSRKACVSHLSMLFPFRVFFRFASPTPVSLGA
jgi:hypothetical protein